MSRRPTSAAIQGCDGKDLVFCRAAGRQRLESYGGFVYIAESVHRTIPILALVEEERGKVWRALRAQKELVYKTNRILAS